jgi:hypothetical protein
MRDRALIWAPPWLTSKKIRAPWAIKEGATVEAITAYGRCRSWVGSRPTVEQRHPGLPLTPRSLFDAPALPLHQAYGCYKPPPPASTPAARIMHRACASCTHHAPCFNASHAPRTTHLHGLCHLSLGTAGHIAAHSGTYMAVQKACSVGLRSWSKVVKGKNSSAKRTTV